MVMAKLTVLAGAFVHASGMDFSFPFTFGSHLYASNKNPFSTAVLVSVNFPLGVGVTVVSFFLQDILASMQINRTTRDHFLAFFSNINDIKSITSKILRKCMVFLKIINDHHTIGVLELLFNETNNFYFGRNCPSLKKTKKNEKNHL